MTLPLPAAGSYTVKIVNQDGAVVAPLYNATVNDLTWNLNAPMSASITVPLQEAQLLDLVSSDGTTLHELQVFRDGSLLAWLVPISFSADSTTATIQCSDPLWLLSKRYVGRLYDVNLLTNGDFESGTTGWTIASGVGATGGYSVNAMSGNQVLEVTGPTGASVNLHHVSQSVNIPATSAEETYVVTGYSWVDGVTTFAPFDPYPLGLVVLVWNGSTVVAGSIDGALRDDESRIFWTRKRCAVKIPAHGSDAYTLTVYLMAPQGKVYWDAVRCVEVEALKYQGTDQATVAGNLVTHAQDTTLGKGDLNIDKSVTATGVYRSVTYSYAAHENILGALQDLAAQDNGFDFDVVCDATTRTFTTYYPAKGVVAPTHTLEWGVNVSAFTWGMDITQAASSVAVTGDGSTDEEGIVDDVEHAYASDSTALGGRLYELVEPAPGGPYAYVSRQERQALETLNARKRPVDFSITTMRHSANDFAALILSGDLQTGDVVDVDIQHGLVQVNEQARITAISLNPATEQVTFTVVPGSIAS